MQLILKVTDPTTYVFDLHKYPVVSTRRNVGTKKKNKTGAARHYLVNHTTDTHTGNFALPELTSIDRSVSWADKEPLRGPDFIFIFYVLSGCLVWCQLRED